ncbi:SDR family NAD(P)-dependent oxidoreductase [Nocardioides terrisoli]|uniref:SDR family NAD(P)-dependent oxidoreductase n=1 Tax=Nocardioides terrisoli TaxID=3388267 RepID=UPI00287B69D3|nr:SDR family NAD(P)-dependent oxidoreductase [Nocardioides marmorisolisilvae]
MKSLEDKVVVVTGAGSGIGRAVALNVAAKGALLAVSDWNEDGLAETVELLKEAGARGIKADRLDVSDKDAFVAYATAVKEHYGRVNVVVNNAGVSHSGPVTAMEYADFEWIVGINFWGVVYGTREFLPHLIESGDGHLVNISSLFGLVSMPGQSTYNATKYAVRGFTEAVREDMILGKHKVGVTCVHPGGIKTGIARNGRTTAGEDHDKLAATFDAKLARMTPDKAAAIIVDGMLAGKARVLVGADAHAIHWTGKLLGSRYQDVFARAARLVLPR